jgi:5-methyltetrahydrofolate--homocysteine methyltransferase
LKKELPLCKISGGVSNVSFSFRGQRRHTRSHTLGLPLSRHQGRDGHGHSQRRQLAVYEEIEPALREAVEDVVLNRREDASERLLEMASRLKGSGQQSQGAVDEWRSEPLERRIAHALVKGDDSFIETDMGEALGLFKNP